MCTQYHRSGWWTAYQVGNNASTALERSTGPVLVVVHGCQAGCLDCGVGSTSIAVVVTGGGVPRPGIGSGAGQGDGDHLWQPRTPSLAAHSQLPAVMTWLHPGDAWWGGAGCSGNDHLHAHECQCGGSWRSAGVGCAELAARAVHSNRLHVGCVGKQVAKFASTVQLQHRGTFAQAGLCMWHLHQSEYCTIRNTLDACNSLCHLCWQTAAAACQSPALQPYRCPAHGRCC
jgi:hypothetical protein